MKKENVPQDTGALGKVTKEICYATDGSGRYTTELSSGWEVKNEALDVAWNDVRRRIEAAREKVLGGQASPLLFFMEYRLMDPSILSEYTGFWKWQIRRHLKPEVFARLSEKKLQRYAQALNVEVGDFETLRIHED